MDEEGTKEDANIVSSPTGGHDENVSSDSSVGGDQIGWGGGVGGRGGAMVFNPLLPLTLLSIPSSNYPSV